MSDEYIKKEDVLKFIEDIKRNKDVPKNYGTLLDIMRYIRKIPTYDIGKVVEQLEERKKYLLKDFVLADKAEEVKERTMARINEIDGILEIVKSGGVADEK